MRVKAYRWRGLILGASLGIAAIGYLPGAACAAPAGTTASAERPIRLALVSEERIPGEDLPAASPGNVAVGSTNQAPGPSSVASPSSAKDQPADEDKDDDSVAGPDENQDVPEPMAPNAEPSPSVGAEASQTLAPGEAAPGAVPSPPPPALDLSAVAPAPDLGAASLAPEIRHASSPALAASIRITEQARRELAQGAADVALRDLGRAVSIDGGNPFAYYYLGRVYLTRKNYSQALTFFQRAELGFAARPDWRGETLSFEGACEEELGREPDAAKAYQEAVADAPGNFRAQAGHGRLGAAVAQPTALDAPPTALDAPPPSADDALPPPLTSPPAPPPAPEDDSRD
ncbi:MAG TPA: tetratricopeptide repeat protein [Candidatus Binataceae bacterium]|nr:tetratricopeptide repeat protein [Candidatus Binataceae bacterium]